MARKPIYAIFFECPGDGNGWSEVYADKAEVLENFIAELDKRGLELCLVPSRELSICILDAPQRHRRVHTSVKQVWEDCSKENEFGRNGGVHLRTRSLFRPN